MMEFTDLQCPYCAEFELQTLPVLRARYVDTGLVKFASYDLPLNFHPYALLAALAAHCAGEQGQYWPYREALYREQSSLPTAPYGQLAQRFGLDLARFESCRSDPERQALVLTDAQKAASKGIQSTPSFVIGRIVNGQFEGELITGAQPLEVFDARLQAALKEARQPAGH